nr:hypothetical protein [Tanacetum cinerariifolium]
PKKVSDALQDPSWVEAMQEELFQFKIQKVWTLVDCPKGVRPIGTKWVLKNKKDERGIVMDVKSSFLYGTIDEEVYVMQPPGFHDPVYPAKVYKVEKAMYGLHQAPRACCVENLKREKFQMSAMGELTFFLGLQVLQKEDGIFLSQDKYIGDILKKFRFLDVRSSNTPMDKENPWGKDGPGKDVELHLYRSMIGSLMYLTASRPDIMFAGHSKLGLWYPKASPFDLVAYSDSDYGGASQDRKSTTGGSQFLGRRVANQEETPSLDNILTLTNRFEDILEVTTNSVDSDGVKADVSNMESTITASPTPIRIHKDHPKSQIIGLVDTPIQTRNKSKEVGEQSFTATIHQKTDPALLQFFLFSCFLSQVKPKKISDALQDPSWVEAIPLGIKWVLKNKKDERGIVIRNKARLVAQGHTQEEGIDNDEVFAPVARIEAIKLFLAYASFMGFTVYHQTDMKSAFLYVYVMQPPGCQDLEFPSKVYKVEKAMYGLHQAPRAWYGTLSKYLLTNGFQRGTIDQTLFIRRQRGDFILVQVYKEDGIFLSQDKYVGDILKKFGYSDVRSSNTSMDKENPCGKDGTEKDVDLYLYRSMIGSLMYLTVSRPDIMFAVCAYTRHQVTPKECHMHAVKRIFRYLKDHPKLGLWCPKESLFDLVAYSDSDYGGATQDRKSTTGGCQFLGRRIISWQCKKQTIVATLTTEAEYVAAASCCGFRISCLIMGTIL